MIRIIEALDYKDILIDASIFCQGIFLTSNPWENGVLGDDLRLHLEGVKLKV